VTEQPPTRTVGQIVDGLGVDSASVQPDDLVTDAVVLLKVVNSDGGVSLYTGHSDGMSWIEKIGMLTAAARIENRGYDNDDDA
jgi:hypothetical protein